jgi:hypothetical protein
VHKIITDARENNQILIYKGHYLPHKILVHNLRKKILNSNLLKIKIKMHYSAITNADIISSKIIGQLFYHMHNTQKN